MDLIVAAEIVKKRKETLPYQCIQDLINKREGEVVLLCCLIQFSIIHTDSPFPILFRDDYQRGDPLAF